MQLLKCVGFHTFLTLQKKSYLYIDRLIIYIAESHTFIYLFSERMNKILSFSAFLTKFVCICRVITFLRVSFSFIRMQNGAKTGINKPFRVLLYFLLLKTCTVLKKKNPIWARENYL